MQFVVVLTTPPPPAPSASSRSLEWAPIRSSHRGPATRPANRWCSPTVLSGGNGSGIIAGSHKGETLDGRGGDDRLYGNGGNDQLLGGTGNDHLYGGAGRDALDGQDGDDILDGGSGNDLLARRRGARHLRRDAGGRRPHMAQQRGSRQRGNSFTSACCWTATVRARAVDVIEEGTPREDRIDLVASHTSFAELTGSTAVAAASQGEPVLGVRTEGRNSVARPSPARACRVEEVAHLSANDFIYQNLQNGRGRSWRCRHRPGGRVYPSCGSQSCGTRA